MMEAMAKMDSNATAKRMELMKANHGRRIKEVWEDEVGFMMGGIG